MSIEALAMARVDYTVCGIDLEVWEHEELEQPPAYLLAEPINSSHEVEKKMIITSSKILLVDELSVKAKMLESAKTIASMNQIAIQFKRSNVFN
ncbi:hypothetical protein PTKIN_Ptkin08bG0143800 [Pterospermum kingtungense]